MEMSRRRRQISYPGPIRVAYNRATPPTGIFGHCGKREQEEKLLEKKFILSLLLLSAAALPSVAQENPNLLTPGERATGWKLLFNGTSMDGWRGYRQAGIPASWKIEDALLKTIPKVSGSSLITVDKFDDFEFSWEWKIAAGGNNGVKYFVTEERPAAPGHEYQMIDDSANEVKLNGPRHGTASFYDVLTPDPGTAAKPAGEWNLSRIVVQGSHVEHWLNSEKVLEYELGSAEVKAGLAQSKFTKFPDFGTKISGHVMLTYHRDECWFRNIKIREIPAN